MEEIVANPLPRPEPTASDLEIKDAQLIFSAVWDDLLEKHGRDNLRFPREFIWLGGARAPARAPTRRSSRETRDITAPPIVISSLLTSPQAVAIKNAGKMVGDREVIGLLFDELLTPQYYEGVIIDGFPRTMVQVECLKLFYHAMLELHGEYRTTPLARFFRKPMFRIAPAVRQRGSQRAAPAETRPGNPGAQPPGARVGRRQAARGTRSPTSTRSCAATATRRSRTPRSTPCNRCGRSSTSTSSTPRAICTRCSRTSCGNSPTRARWS